MQTIGVVVAILGLLYTIFWGRKTIWEIVEEFRKKRGEDRGASKGNRPVRVFISYSRKDLVFVERLAWDLKAVGLDVWYDLSGLEAGSRWGREIQNAIQQSQYFVVVLSPNSVASDWVEREFLYANNLKRKVVPLLYIPCDMPIWLVDLQYIDVQGKKYKENFSQLLKALDVGSVKPASDVEKPAPSESAASSPQRKKEAPKRAIPADQRGVKVRRVLAGVAVLAILLSAGLIFGRPPSPCSIVPQLCPTPTPTPTATPDPNPYDGTWAGTTSQNYRLIFTVTHNVITYVFTTIHTESGDARCPTGVRTLVDTPVIYPIEKKAVSSTFENELITLTANGIFSSDTSASGSLFFVVKGDCVSSVDVTWTASKQTVMPASTPTSVAALDPSIQKALNEIKNKAPLYITGCDQLDSLCDESTVAYGPGKLWDSIGNVAIRDGRIIASSQDIQLDGVSLTAQPSHSFAAEFEFKVEAYGGGCAFMASNNEFETLRFSGFDLYFREDGLMELNRNELPGDSYRVAFSSSQFKFYKYNTITVIVLGEKIAVFINDLNAVGNFDPKPTIDYSVFRIGSYDSGECEFDNFKLWDLTALNP